MAIQMRALDSFYGDEGQVRGGSEFSVEHEGRAKALQDAGLAERVKAAAPAPVTRKPTGRPRIKR